jgi:hypothetical protein
MDIIAGADITGAGKVEDFVTTGVGVGSGAGAGTETGGDADTTGTETGAGVGAEDGAPLLAKTVPFSRLTRFKGAVFPAKNSAAVSEGSEDGAGG